MLKPGGLVGWSDKSVIFGVGAGPLSLRCVSDAVLPGTVYQTNTDAYVLVMCWMPDDMVRLIKLERRSSINSNFTVPGSTHIYIPVMYAVWYIQAVEPPRGRMAGSLRRRSLASLPRGLHAHLGGSGWV